MTSGANNNLLSRILVVGLAALAFAGCAAMLARGDRSLFSDQTYAPAVAYAEAAS